MAITWYSLPLMEQPELDDLAGANSPEGVYSCQTERHASNDVQAAWVEQLLDLEEHAAWHVWFACHSCHNALADAYQEEAD